MALTIIPLLFSGGCTALRASRVSSWLATPFQDVSSADELAKPGIKIVHFWASWCPSCVAELPSISALADYAQLHKIELILVATNDTEADIERVLIRKGLSFPRIYLDNQGLLADRFQAQSLPVTFALSDGELVPIRDPESHKYVLKIEGSRAWNKKQKFELIEELSALQFNH